MEGKYQGTHILIDDQTGSLWTPAFGKAVHGPLKGARLERLPVYLTPGDEWKTLEWLDTGLMGKDDHFDSRIFRAQVRAATGNRDGARQDLEAALKLQPGRDDVRQMLDQLR